MARDMMGTCGEIISAAGGQVFLQPSTVSPETLGLDYNHYAGTARMGRAPEPASSIPMAVVMMFPISGSATPPVFAAYPEESNS